MTDHAQIDAKIEKVGEALEYHIGQTHMHLVEQSEIAAADARIMEVAVSNRQQIGLVMDTLIGPVDKFTGVRDKEQGLNWRHRQVETKVDTLFKKLGNGDPVKAKLSSPQQIALYTTALAIIARLFGVEFPTP